MYADIQKIKEYITKKETTTMFDDDAKDVHPDDWASIYGESTDEPPVEAYDDPSSIPF